MNVHQWFHSAGLLPISSPVNGRGNNTKTRYAVIAVALSLAAQAFAASDPGPWLFSEPRKQLEKSSDPCALAETLLDAGERRAIEEYSLSLSVPKQAELFGKVSGLLRMYDGDYAGALAALGNAGDPWSMQRKLYLEALLRAQAGFVENASEHFRLRTPPAQAFLARIALPALESAYGKMADIFQVKLDTPMVVEVYPSAETFSAASTLSPETLERSGAIGICKFGRLMILSPRATPLGYRWLDALAHEFVHATVNRLSGSRCPLWLHEGVARYYETAWRRTEPFALSPHDETALAEASGGPPGAVAEGVIPFKRMEPSMVYLENQDQVSLAFAEVADAVSTVLEENEPEKLAELLRAFKMAARADAFKSALGQSEEDLENAWKESLSARAWSVAPGAMGQKIYLKAVDEAAFVGADAQGHIRLGDRLRQQNQLDAALSQYKKAMEKEPANGVALLKASRVLLAQEKQKEAEGHLRTAVKMNPSYITPFVTLGELLTNDGRYDEAQIFLQEALEINPFHPRVHELLGLIALDVGNFAAARQCFELVLELEPGNNDARQALHGMPKGR